MIYLTMIGPWQLTLLLILLLGLILPIIALIDILKNDFKGNNKIVWVLVVLFLNSIGAILYFTIGKDQRLQN